MKKGEGEGTGLWCVAEKTCLKAQVNRTLKEKKDWLRVPAGIHVKPCREKHVLQDTGLYTQPPVGISKSLNVWPGRRDHYLESFPGDGFAVWLDVGLSTTDF